MNFQGSNLRPGIQKTCEPSGTSSHIALTQVARLQKGYMLSGKEVYFVMINSFSYTKINLGFVFQRPTLLLGYSEKEWKRYYY